MNEDVCEVIITAPDAEWLGILAQRLVAAHMAASAHVFAPIRSVYRWQGEQYDKTEARVALHTRRALVPQIIERTKRVHPYQVPCVVATPLVDGNPEYVQWIIDETQPPTHPIPHSDADR